MGTVGERNWTDEQLAIAACRDPVLVVEAGAGCAKTSSLELYAQQNPRDSMLYLAFNKSVKEEAQKRFPKNVKCMTTHGAAYGRFGIQFSNAGKLGTPRPTEVQKLFPGMTAAAAGLVLATVGNFCNSAVDFIDEDHVLAAMRAKDDYPVGHVIDAANALWNKMQDLGSPGVKMPHDGYLKLFQLSRPRLSHGVILLDEAQDANPVTLDIIGQQERSRKVYVGDSHQAIYGFRGAVDALSGFDDATRLRLTGSFRFGQGIAGLSSALLREWGCSDFPLVGLGKHQTVFAVDTGRTHAYLCRCNGSIFDRAIIAAKHQRPYGFVGGIDGYRFDQILDVYHLMSGELPTIRDSYIKSFGRFDEIVRYAEEMDDGELKSIIKVVKEYGSEIPFLVDLVKSKAISFGSISMVPKSIIDAGMVFFSTVHKAKGLEWLDIVLGDDFTTLEMKPQKDGPPKFPDKEEINILYVALTRAQRGVELPVQVKDWLNETGQWHLAKSTPAPVMQGKENEFSAVDQTENAGGVGHHNQSFDRGSSRRDVKIVETRPLRDVTPEAKIARIQEAANVMFSALSEQEAEFRRHLEEHQEVLGAIAGPMAQWFDNKASKYRELLNTASDS